MISSIIPQDRIACCLTCKGEGILPVGCGFTPCGTCQGRGFLYLPGARVPSPPACVHGPRGGEKIIKAAAALALVLGFLGCVSRPPVRPAKPLACECRPALKSFGEYSTAIDAEEAAAGAVVRVEAQQAASAVANPEESQREGEAAYKLGEVQSGIEGLVKP